jgi:hypothetical protein
MTGEHEHRPDLASQRAALAAAYAALLGDDPAAHEAASGGSCPSCTVLAGISLGFAVAASDAGETGLMSPAMRLRLLAWVKVTQAELDTGLN